MSLEGLASDCRCRFVEMETAVDLDGSHQTGGEIENAVCQAFSFEIQGRAETATDAGQRSWSNTSHWVPAVCSCRLVSDGLAPTYRLERHEVGDGVAERH